MAASKAYDFLIIGAGIAGVLLAYQALNVDMSVLLHATDKFDPMHLLAGKVFKTSSVEHDEHSSGDYQHKFLFRETSSSHLYCQVPSTLFSRTATRSP